MRHRAGGDQRVADEQPARARLDRDVHLSPREAPDPAAHSAAIGGDPPPADLARLAVKRVEGDLRAMHIEPGYDRHEGSPL